MKLRPLLRGIVVLALLAGALCYVEGSKFRPPESDYCMASPQVVVLSRDDAERYQPQGVEVCISITDPDAPEVRLASDFAAVLRLQFTDIASPGGPGDVLFAREHAERILDFLSRWTDAERIVVHCVAGASRSPGVALGLCDRFGWPTTPIEKAKPLWNTLVRRVLAEL